MLRTLPGPHTHSVGLPACYHSQRLVPALCGAFELALGVHHCHAYAARLCFVVDFGFKTAAALFSYGVTGNLEPSNIALLFSPMAQMKHSS